MAQPRKAVELAFAPGVRISRTQRPHLILGHGVESMVKGLRDPHFHLVGAGVDIGISDDVAAALRRFERPVLLDEYEFVNLIDQPIVARLVHRKILQMRWRRADIENAITPLNAGLEGPLFFVFLGIQGGLMGPAHEFLARTGLTAHNLVMFRDGSGQYFSRGVSFAAPSMPALLAWQEGYHRSARTTEQPCTLGVSMGAFAAIQAGHYLEAKTVWALGLTRSIYEDGRRHARALEWDLRKLLATHNGVTEYRLYFNEECDRDCRAARRLTGLPGVTLVPQTGKGHDVIAPLVASGEIASLFPPAPNPARARASAHFPDDLLTPILQFLSSITPTGQLIAATAPLGLDSLSIVQVSAFLDARFGVSVPAGKLDFLVSGTPEDLVALVRSEVTLGPDCVASPPCVPKSLQTIGGERSMLLTDGRFASWVEIGLPLTGQNQLAETPLLKLVGDLQWKHTAAISGVPSEVLADASGARLYATFFYVECSFSDVKPLAAYKMNDRITIVGSLERFGTSILDGHHYILPWADVGMPLPNSNASPYVRLSSIFVQKWRGASWLKKSSSVEPGIQNIPELSAPPDAYSIVQRAKSEGQFFEPQPGYLPLSSLVLYTEERIEPDRDLNGAGVLYFANYFSFLDIAERRLLGALEDFTFGQEVLDRRTLVHRRSAFFSNASSTDTLAIQMRGWIEDPFALDEPNPADAPVRLLLNFWMHRKSDGRLMMISSARKVIVGFRLGEIELYDQLESLVRAGAPT